MKALPPPDVWVVDLPSPRYWPVKEELVINMTKVDGVWTYVPRTRTYEGVTWTINVNGVDINFKAAQ